MVSPAWSQGYWEYIYLGTRLASHGFVVAVTEHAEDWQWPWSSGTDIPVTLFNRPRDVSLGLDPILSNRRKS